MANPTIEIWRRVQIAEIKTSFRLRNWLIKRVKEGFVKLSVKNQFCLYLTKG